MIIRSKLPRISGPEENFPGADYTDDESEFLEAIDRYRRERRRKFPTCREVLYVLLSLGYRKTDATSLKEERTTESQRSQRPEHRGAASTD